MHQLPKDDEDYEDELSNLNASWKLPKPSEPDYYDKDTKDLSPGQKPNTLHRKSQAMKRVFVPISDQFGASRSAFARPGGGYHWSLLLWEIDATYFEVNNRFGTSEVKVFYRHFDSSRGCNALAAAAVAKRLHDVLCSSFDELDDVLCASASKVDGIAKVEVIECKTPQQRNGYDCGVLTLGFAEALSTSDGFVKKVEDYESLLQSYFEENGGHGEFAFGLRERIGDDIRELAK